MQERQFSTWGPGSVPDALITLQRLLERIRLLRALWKSSVPVVVLPAASTRPQTTIVEEHSGAAFLIGEPFRTVDPTTTLQPVLERIRAFRAFWKGLHSKSILPRAVPVSPAGPGRPRSRNPDAAD
jgi:hypothetical protein